MQNWLLFAVIPPMMWGLTNTLDSSIRKNFLKSDFAFTWFVAASRLPFVILLFYIAGFQAPGIGAVLFMLIGGIIWLYPPMIWYLKACETEDASRISLMIQMTPVFTLLIAFFAIKEALSPDQFAAFVLLLSGGMLASFKKTEGRLKFGKAFFLILAATFLWAVSDVIFKKFEPAFPDFLSAFAYYTLGDFMVSIFMMSRRSGRREIFNHLQSLSKTGWALLITTQTAGIIGSIAFAYALTLGKASLTSVILGIQPFFAIIFGLILGGFLRGIHKEDLSGKALLFRGISFVMIIFGLILL